MDIQAITPADEAQELTLLHPGTKQPLDGVLLVVGTDSDIYRAKDRELSRKMLKRAGNRGINLKDMTPEELETGAAERLAACITGWRNISVGGEELPYSPANAMDLMKNYAWIKEQVEDFCTDRANFIKG